jgi:glucoamylase
MWLDGTANWTAIQMDSTGFAVLLADALRRSGELAQWSPTADMVRAAAGFLAKNGPCTQQDRWEENAGYDPNTMSVEIAALLAAADFADEQQDSRLAEFLRATADAWSDAIDELTYVAGTDLDRQHGVRGHYVRIAPPEVIRTGLSDQTLLTMKNLPENEAVQRAVDVVSPGTLALVRFGMRSAQDPRIVDSLKIIDATLRSELLNGPVWHRYTSDGYGEKEDGAPFDKTGKGRGWPLLTGERAHYEIAAGNFEVAERLLHAIAAQTNECGLIPEQVWDAADLPERGLFNGQPTGSGMPLVWAHAEYVRLLRSLRERRVWDMPPQTVQRYQVDKKTADFMIWNFNHQRQRLASGKKLRLDLWNSARVHWSSDGWQTREDTGTIDSGIGLHYAMLPVSRMKPGEYLRFTMFWLEANKWEGRNFEVKVI